MVLSWRATVTREKWWLKSNGGLASSSCWDMFLIPFARRNSGVSIPFAMIDIGKDASIHNQLSKKNQYSQQIIRYDLWRKGECTFEFYLPRYLLLRTNICLLITYQWNPQEFTKQDLGVPTMISYTESISFSERPSLIPLLRRSLKVERQHWGI